MGYIYNSGISYSILTGNAMVINNEIIESGTAAWFNYDLNATISNLDGTYENSWKNGLIKQIAKLMTLFYLNYFKVPKGHESIGYIASNVAVNMAGLGSAATPFGLKAGKLQELNEDKKEQQLQW